MQETIDSIHAYFERFSQAIRLCLRDAEQYDVWFSGFRGPGNWEWLRSLRRNENQEEARRVQADLDALQQHKATLKTPIALGRQELLSRSRDGDPQDQLDKAENYLRRVLTWYRQDESFWGEFHEATTDDEVAIVVEQLKASDDAFPLRQKDVDRLIEELRIAESIVLRPYELANIKAMAEVQQNASSDPDAGKSLSDAIVESGLVGFLSASDKMDAVTKAESELKALVDASPTIDYAEWTLRELSTKLGRSTKTVVQTPTFRKWQSQNSERKQQKR